MLLYKMMSACDICSVDFFLKIEAELFFKINLR